MTVHQIRPIYDQPGHKHYGPVRRLWCMLEQLFANRGGVKALEAAIVERNPGRPRWDEHLANLIDGGQSECAAQRIVMQQMLVAGEYFGL